MRGRGGEKEKEKGRGRKEKGKRRKGKEGGREKERKKKEEEGRERKKIENRRDSFLALAPRGAGAICAAVPLQRQPQNFGTRMVASPERFRDPKVRGLPLRGTKRARRFEMSFLFWPSLRKREKRKKSIAEV